VRVYFCCISVILTLRTFQTVSENDTISHAIQKIYENKAISAAIVDSDGKLVGMSEYCIIVMFLLCRKFQCVRLEIFWSQSTNAN
jgi:hypothetical protein